MPIYTVAGPDGKTYEIEGPAGASADQLGSAIQAHASARSDAANEATRASMAKEYAPDGLGQSLKEQGGNLLAGAVRGAGSIGATIVDAARGLGQSAIQAAPAELRPQAASEVMNAPTGEALRSGMDGGLQQMGADPAAPAYRVGKVGMEVAGSMGAGGAAANVLSRAGTVSPALVQALRTAGMDASGSTGASGLALRAAGGAANGALTAGLVDPKDALSGAAVGGVAAPVAAVVGQGLEKVGNASAEKLAEQLSKYKAQAPLRETIEKSVDAGYVIPPNMVKPGFLNQTIESFSGKQATQQIASTKNTEVTEGLVRKALGIADDAPLSRGTLEGIRKGAGTAYGDIAALSPQAATDLEALKVARNEAQGWFKAYNRSASPLDLAKAKEARTLSDSLEQALEQHAQQAGKDELIPALRDARKQIAKSYTVERSLNDASGTIDARVLGRMYEKGAPLTDELKTAARFASAFPTIAKSPQQVGSPAAHNLRALASALMGGGGAAAMGPMGVAAAAVPFAAPPLARALMFRQGAQRGLVEAAPQAGRAAALAIALRDPEIQQAILKATPVLATAGAP